MLVKKFVCDACGAPKINEYFTPYIVCDYCGGFVDIDLTLFHNQYTQDQAKTDKFIDLEDKFFAEFDEAIHDLDKNKFFRLKYKYRDLYLKTFPAHISPLIDTADKYELYLNIYARIETGVAFDETSVKKSVTLSQLQKELTYYVVDEMPKVEPVSFFKLAEYYIRDSKESVQKVFNSPDGEALNNLFPQPIFLKVVLSKFTQIWLPYLQENEAERLLKMTGFRHDFIELEKPNGEELSCEHCKEMVFAPEGSYKVYCENCNKTSRVKTVFHCMNCGSENKVPENPAKPVNCAHCGTENRLIQGLNW